MSLKQDIRAAWRDREIARLLKVAERKQAKKTKAQHKAFKKEK